MIRKSSAFMESGPFIVISVRGPSQERRAFFYGKSLSRRIGRVKKNGPFRRIVLRIPGPDDKIIPEAGAGEPGGFSPVCGMTLEALWTI